MRIAYLSSYTPMECGIATYTEFLNTAVRKRQLDTFVVAPFGSSGEGVHPTYRSGCGDFAPDVFQMMLQQTPDVVHIQHEYGLFGPNMGMEVVDLVLRLKLIEVPVVITLHTVYEQLKREERFVLKHLLAECAGIIVHEDFQRDTLENELGAEIAAKVTVIDHGVREVEPVPNAKKLLGLDGQKVVMLTGYFRPSKGFHKAADFFGEVAEAHPDAVLVLAGKTRNIEYADYRNDLLAEFEASPFADRIRVLTGQFPQHTFDTLLSAADVIVLPYDIGAQSGVLSQSIAFGRPVVASQLPAFKAVLRRSRSGIASADEDLATNINRILGDDRFAARCYEGAAHYVRHRGGWSTIAGRHEDLYRSVCAPSDGSIAIHIPDPATTPDIRSAQPVVAIPPEREHAATSRVMASSEKLMMQTSHVVPARTQALRTERLSPTYPPPSALGMFNPGPAADTELVNWLGLHA